MATISSAGLGSGIDIDGIVSKLMSVERAPLNAMKTREEKIKEQLSAFGSIKGALSSFRDAMRGLDSLEKYRQKKVGISDEKIAKVATNTSAVPGSYDVQVSRLAQSQKLASKAFESTDDIVGEGKLKIEFGTFADGTFTANPDKEAKTVVIDAGSSSLSGIRDAINRAKVGVSASILNDGTGYRLVIKSDDSGVANGLRLSVTEDSDNDNGNAGGLSVLNYDPAVTYPVTDTVHMRSRVSAQDAQLIVDGVEVKKSSNVFNDVIEGVTMNLNATTAVGTSVKVDVAQDKDKIKEAIGSFVETYNNLRTVVKDLTAYNPATKTGAVLQGDYMARSIANRVSGILADTVEGLTGKYGFLAEIGIKLGKDGTLSKNDAKLDEALQNNPDDVAALFSQVGRSSDGLVRFAASTSKTIAGTYDVNVTQVGRQAELSVAGIGAGPFTVNNSDSMALIVDGVTSGAIIPAAKDYATADELAAELQAKINADSALRRAGKSVFVSAAAGNLKFTSRAFGASSSIEISSMSVAGINFSGSGTPGADAAGSIGGTPASGKGQHLLGATGTDMEGLSIQVLGGATGARGSVSFSHGYAFELGNLADTLLSADGGLTARTDSLNSQVEQLKKRQQAFEDRMVMVERRLKAQYNAMDKMVSQLRSTSDYLSRQLR